ncbi:MAG: transposase [Sphingobacteriales bacterium]|nr:transposase [Sphingobacteriales bacterium]
MLLGACAPKIYEAKDYDKANANAVLSLIQDLYKIESYCRDENFTPEQIKNHRHEHAPTRIKQFAKHINRNVAHQKVLPKSPFGKAIAYTLTRWQKLCVYTTDGILQIDNNLIENAIRPVALGRKNYLFAGSHERAQDAAMLYSLFATCRLHNINPEHWLTYLLEKINSTKKENLHLLLPQNYVANFKQQ